MIKNIVIVTTEHVLNALYRYLIQLDNKHIKFIIFGESVEGEGQKERESLQQAGKT